MGEIYYSTTKRFYFDSLLSGKSVPLLEPTIKELNLESGARSIQPKFPDGSYDFSLRRKECDLACKAEVVLVSER